MSQIDLVSYRRRMCIAQMFRSALNADNARAELMKRLALDSTPVIIPALEDTQVTVIYEAASRHFSKGEQHVLVPVGISTKDKAELHISVLTISQASHGNLGQLSLEDLQNRSNTGEVVAAIDPAQRWEIQETLDAASLKFLDSLPNV